MFNLTSQQRSDLELIIKAAEAMKALGKPTNPAMATNYYLHEPCSAVATGSNWNASASRLGSNASSEANISAQYLSSSRLGANAAGSAR